MEQGQNLSIFEADKLVGQTLSQLRPVYRQALIDVYGADHRLIISHPSGQHLEGLRLGDMDEEKARDILWFGAEFLSSSERVRLHSESDDHGVSELAAALPFILSALLLVERHSDFHLSFFSIVLEKKEAFDEIVYSLKRLTDDQRRIVASVMRAALLCYANYAMRDGLEDDCILSSAGDTIIYLLYYIRQK